MILRYAVWKNGKIIKDGLLKDCRVTATENAKSHQGLPNKVFGGYQAPLDLALWPSGGYDPSAEYKIYCADERVDVVEQASNLGNYVAVRGKSTGVKVLFVHVNMHNFKKGEILSEGATLCRIAPKEENGGYPVHLHLDMNKDGLKTRDLLYNPIVAIPEEPEEPCKSKLDAMKAQFDKDLQKERDAYSALRDEKIAVDSLLLAANEVIAGLQDTKEKNEETIQELVRVNESLKKKRKASLDDFTVQEKMKDYREMTRAKFLNLINALLDWLKRKLG